MAFFLENTIIMREATDLSVINQIGHKSLVGLVGFLCFCS